MIIAPEAIEMRLWLAFASLAQLISERANQLAGWSQQQSNAVGGRVTDLGRLLAAS